jgi:uncharacterized protein (DUF885 family)
VRRQPEAIAVFAAMILVLAGAAHADASADLKGLVSDYARLMRAEDPVRAGARGDRAALARWPDASPAAIDQRRADLLAIETRLKALSGAPLAGEDALNRDILQWRVAMELEGLRFDQERMPFVSGEGFFTLADDTAQSSVIHDPAEAQAWLTRMDALPGYYATAMANMRRGLATGFVQPRGIVDIAIKATQASLAQPPEASDLLAPFANLPPSMPKAVQAALRARAVEIVKAKVEPAQRALLDFFQREYLPKARAEIAARSLPDGRAYYAYLVRFHTTTNITPDEVHALGLARVAQIHREMEATIARTGFKGSFAEFLTFLRQDPRFYATDGDDYLERARAIAKRIDYKLPLWIGVLPRLTYGVEPVPPALELSSGGYRPGSPEQGAAGSVMVRPSHFRTEPLYSLPAWLLHEGVPGHHIQIALAQENSDLPEYRRNDDLTAFVEGWALYSEGLGEEMGVYQDDYERFGRLSYEMWRACRLVVDTGIHWDGWSRDQAIAYLRDNTALSQTAIEGEVDRYIAWPGQSVAYMIGDMRIEALRRRAEARLGPRFDIRRFHDFILDDGPMPLGLLDARLDAWIDREASSGGR